MVCLKYTKIEFLSKHTKYTFLHINLNVFFMCLSAPSAKTPKTFLKIHNAVSRNLSKICVL